MPSTMLASIEYARHSTRTLQRAHTARAGSALCPFAGTTSPHGPRAPSMRRRAAKTSRASRERRTPAAIARLGTKGLASSLRQHSGSILFLWRSRHAAPESRAEECRSALVAAVRDRRMLWCATASAARMRGGRCRMDRVGDCVR
jgi:hypothetical protein